MSKNKTLKLMTFDGGYGMVGIQLPHTKMKNIQKNTTRKLWRRFVSLPVLVVVGALMIGGSVYHVVHADTLQEQINALQSENAGNQSVVDQLQSQAASYEDAIRILNSQISSL